MKSKKKAPKHAVEFSDSIEFDNVFSVEGVPEKKLRKAFLLQDTTVLLAHEIFEIAPESDDVQKALNALLVAYNQSIDVVINEW